MKMYSVTLDFPEGPEPAHRICQLGYRYLLQPTLPEYWIMIQNISERERYTIWMMLLVI